MKKIRFFLIVIIVIVLNTIALSKYNALEAEVYRGDKVFKSVLIKNGDNLYDLADKYGATSYKQQWILEVCNANHMLDENSIIAGNYIVVPVYNPLKIEIKKN